MIHVDSYHNESRTSACIAYAGSTRANVQRAIDIEAGARAVKHYERMGLIQFPDKQQSRHKAQAQAMSDEERLEMLKKVIEGVSKGQRASEICADLGIPESTARGWSQRFKMPIAETRWRITDDMRNQVISLINDNGTSLAAACEIVGCSPQGIRTQIKARGLRYNPKQQKITKNG